MFSSFIISDKLDKVSVFRGKRINRSLLYILILLLKFGTLIQTAVADPGFPVEGGVDLLGGSVDS